MGDEPLQFVLKLGEVGEVVALDDGLQFLRAGKGATLVRTAETLKARACAHTHAWLRRERGEEGRPPR